MQPPGTSWLGDKQILIVYVVSLACWAALYWLATPLLCAALRLVSPKHAALVSGGYHKLSADKQALWRRLARSMIYYVYATIFGCALMSRIRSAADMFWDFSTAHSFAYATAASHFTLLIYEDYRARKFLSVNPEAQDSKSSRQEGLGVLAVYTVHHLLTVTAFGLGIHTHQLGSMYNFGLLFEGPVIFSTIREFFIAFNDDFGLLRLMKPRWMFANWALVLFMFISCRLTSIGVFFWTATVWREEYLYQMTTATQASFWVFGTAFGFVNYGWAALLIMWFTRDYKLAMGRDIGSTARPFSRLPTYAMDDRELAGLEEGAGSAAPAASTVGQSASVIQGLPVWE